jgi:adenine deaminase
VNVDWDRVDLRTPAAEGSRARVVELVPGAIVTGAGEVEAPVAEGALAADPERDLALLCVIERHTGAGGSAAALVKGFGLEAGALGSSVAHDHHNLIVAGASEAEIERAARALADLGGGLVAVRGDEVLAAVPLPIAGLMSLREADELSAQHRAAIAAARELGSTLDDPFMSLSFLGLEVIPELKLTDRGLVDVVRFELTDSVR